MDTRNNDAEFLEQNATVALVWLNEFLQSQEKDMIINIPMHVAHLAALSYVCMEAINAAQGKVPELQMINALLGRIGGHILKEYPNHTMGAFAKIKKELSDDSL